MSDTAEGYSHPPQWLLRLNDFCSIIRLLNGDTCHLEIMSASLGCYLASLLCKTCRVLIKQLILRAGRFGLAVNMLIFHTFFKSFCKEVIHSFKVN